MNKREYEQWQKEQTGETEGYISYTLRKFLVWFANITVIVAIAVVVIVKLIS